MSKSILFFAYFICGNIFAQTLAYENMPCEYDGAGRITDSSGVSINSGSQILCTTTADEMKLTVYKIGLCKSAPTFSLNADPNLTQCTIIFESAGGNEVVVSKTSGLTLPNLTRPENGTYTHFLFIHSNTIGLKAKAEFESPRVVDGEINGGNFCWTTSGGTVCGASVDNSYNFEVISNETNDSNQGNLEATPFSGNVQEYFTDSNLRLSSTLDNDPALRGGITSMWVNIFYPSTPVIVSDLTRGLKLGINISAGADIYFETGAGSPREILSIADAPFAYKVEAVQ